MLVSRGEDVKVYKIPTKLRGTKGTKGTNRKQSRVRKEHDGRKSDLSTLIFFSIRIAYLWRASSAPNSAKPKTAWSVLKHVTEVQTTLFGLRARPRPQPMTSSSTVLHPRYTPYAYRYFSFFSVAVHIAILHTPYSIRRRCCIHQCHPKCRTALLEVDFGIVVSDRMHRRLRDKCTAHLPPY